MCREGGGRHQERRGAASSHKRERKGIAAAFMQLKIKRETNGVKEQGV